MASKQVSVDASAEADSTTDDGVHELRSDVAYQRLMIVNVVYCGSPEAREREWVLIDAGVMGSTRAIERAADQRFGRPPAAIVLTHAHFDHVGVLEDLLELWDVPVYAHELEVPYLDGSASYPAPDPSVGGGMMSTLSRLYPRGPIDVSSRLRTLPPDGSIPAMPDWQWIHVPGHTPGQVALWRDSDKTLLAADAFITTRQESAYAVMTQRPELHGPPMYYTQDWSDARMSVERLAGLEPELVITGHGPAMQGAEMRSALHVLARDFERVAVPQQGRYVNQPTNVESGTAYPPPK